MRVRKVFGSGTKGVGGGIGGWPEERRAWMRRTLAFGRTRNWRVVDDASRLGFFLVIIVAEMLYVAGDCRR